MIFAFYNTMGFFEQRIKKMRPAFSKKCITEQELIGYDDGDSVIVGGMIADVRTVKTKKGDAMGFITLVDLDESIDVTVFPRTWAACRSEISKDAIVEIRGRKSTYGGKQNLIQAESIEQK
jgi:DNA polymerase-3 subunit alpha